MQASHPRVTCLVSSRGWSAREGALSPDALVPLGEGYSAAATLAEWNADVAGSAATWPRFTSCPTCGSTDIRALATIRSMRHDRCRNCGFVLVNPYPPDDVRDSFYNSPYYDNYRLLEDRKRREDPYFSVSMYTDASRLASAVAATSSSRVLDYGCGTGAFLALLRDRFGVAEVEGFEIGSEAREIARGRYGLKIAGAVQDLQHREYDCVLLLEVIEHVPDPRSFLEEVTKLVAPGGYLLITTPAVDNMTGRWLARMCLHYTAPSHVSLFTETALRSLMQRYSFDVTMLETDRASGFARTAVLSLLYRLDFSGPRNDEDSSDALYSPTILGRLLGKTVTRSPSIPVPLAFRALDAALSRIARRRPDHYYMLARRRAAP